MTALIVGLADREAWVNSARKGGIPARQILNCHDSEGLAKCSCERQ